MSKARLSRDTVLFVSGLSGIAYETLLEKSERPTLLVLFAAMVGLPAFLRTDEKKPPKPKDDPPATA